MTHEGRLRENILIRAEWHDSDPYAILGNRWKGRWAMMVEHPRDYDDPLIAELYDQFETYTDDVELLRRLIGGAGPLKILSALAVRDESCCPWPRMGTGSPALSSPSAYERELPPRSLRSAKKRGAA